MDKEFLVKCGKFMQQIAAYLQGIEDALKDSKMFKLNKYDKENYYDPINKGVFYYGIKFLPSNLDCKNFLTVAFHAGSGSDDVSPGLGAFDSPIWIWIYDQAGSEFWNKTKQAFRNNCRTDEDFWVIGLPWELEDDTSAEDCAKAGKEFGRKIVALF